MPNDVFFSPGRTELAGNHTDHQQGRVLAAAVRRGLVAECVPTDSSLVEIQSHGFGTIKVQLHSLDVRPEEFGTTEALVRGVAWAFRQLDLNIGGFFARVRSTLSAGSGLSSSAAFSVLIGKIFNRYYNGDRVSPLVLARTAKEAENRHFGKPCGLMDQIACVLGGCVYADFYTGELQMLDADFRSMGLKLCLTDTGGSHAGLNSSYARIPADMQYVAGLFEKETLAEVPPEEFYAKHWNTADRPVRRALHFFEENERVPKMRDALLRKDGETYMRLMNESGRSSEKYLNNIVTSATGDTRLEQGLECSAKLLDGIGAWRVHGGGFAGCVQALMPRDFYSEYKQGMEAVFGKGKCRETRLLRPQDIKRWVD
jgi:galactokinase